MRRAAFVYLFIFTFMFSFGALDRYENFSEQHEIERLLNERIGIINDFLYGEKDEDVLEELQSKLSKIESGVQLNSDMSLLTHIYHNPTDYERATKVKILKLKDIVLTEDSIEILANLEWTILGGDINDKFPVASTFVKDYNINCIIKNKSIYLTNLKFVE